MKKNNTVFAMAFGLLFFVFILSVAYPSNTYANAPKEVKLTYDSSTQNLTVTITHKSPFPNSHYIKKVEIKKNGQAAGSMDYKNQPDKATFAYSYKVEAADGDTLEVTATCSMYGSKTEKLIITKPGAK
jgi:hypothetical protein